MTAKPSLPPRFTREEYYELGRLEFFDGQRVELIRGEVIEMSPIDIAHAQGVGLAHDALLLVFAVGYYINVQQPFCVPGAPFGSEPQPDVAVIPGSRRANNDHPTRAALLVEVADATLFYDTTTKAELYAEAGVTDYWVLDLQSQQLIVFRDPQPLAAGLNATAYRSRQTFGSNDAAVRVADLLP